MTKVHWRSPFRPNPPKIRLVEVIIVPHKFGTFNVLQQPSLTLLSL